MEARNMSEEASLSISTTPLLQQPRIKNLENLIAKTTLILRLVIVLLVGFSVLYSIYSKNANPKPPQNGFLSDLSKYYCHLTPHTKLCLDSMPSIITNFMELEPNPARLFTASLQLVADELNRTAISISKALSSPSSSNTSLIRPRMFACRSLVDESLSRLNGSLSLLGADMHFSSWIPYVEGLNIGDEMTAVENNIRKCLLGLGEIDGYCRKQVEVVESGVMKANRLAANFMSLFESRQSVIDDFYNPYYMILTDENSFALTGHHSYFDHFYYYFYDSDSIFLVCLFGVMYLFIGLLYFLFRQQ